MVSSDKVLSNILMDVCNLANMWLEVTGRGTKRAFCKNLEDREKQQR